MSCSLFWVFKQRMFVAVYWPWSLKMGQISCYLYHWFRTINMRWLTTRTLKKWKIVLYFFSFLLHKFSSSLPKFVEFWFNCGNAVSFVISVTTFTPPLLSRSLRAGWCPSDPKHALDLIDALGCSGAHIHHYLLQELQIFKDVSSFKNYYNCFSFCLVPMSSKENRTIPLILSHDTKFSQCTDYCCVELSSYAKLDFFLKLSQHAPAYVYYRLKQHMYINTVMKYQLLRGYMFRPWNSHHQANAEHMQGTLYAMHTYIVPCICSAFAWWWLFHSRNL